MNILGISAFYHDSAACLISEGKIIAAAQEERFTRKKHESGFPHHAIRYCLEQAKIDNVNVFTLLDTLKGLNDIQLSTVVAEVLNYNRDATSSVGFKRPQTVDKIEKRNIVV